MICKRERFSRATAKDRQQITSKSFSKSQRRLEKYLARSTKICNTETRAHTKQICANYLRETRRPIIRSKRDPSYAVVPFTNGSFWGLVVYTCISYKIITRHLVFLKIFALKVFSYRFYIVFYSISTDVREKTIVNGTNNYEAKDRLGQDGNGTSGEKLKKWHKQKNTWLKINRLENRRGLCAEYWCCRVPPGEKTGSSKTESAPDTEKSG